MTKSKKILIMLIISVTIFTFMSPCSTQSFDKVDKSLVMVINSKTSTYGTGFAVGIPGNVSNTIVTASSVVSTSNGTPNDSVEIMIEDSGETFSADVIFYDTARNIAILKISKSVKGLRPMVLCDFINDKEDINVYGYGGTGNITTSYESFDATELVKYTGEIGDMDDDGGISKFAYSREFNRAVVGSPAFNEGGNCVGMCSYSLSSMNTYSQYILSSEEISKCLAYKNLDYITSSEMLYKRIIFLTLILGVLSLLILFFAFIGKEKLHRTQYDNYVYIIGGVLNKNIYEFNKKLVIGRDEQKCDIVYPEYEPGISAVHCSIVEINGKRYLVDNFSKFGTYLINRTRIEPEHPYEIKDKKVEFYLGNTKNKISFVQNEVTNK